MDKKERFAKIASIFKASQDHGVLQNVSNVTSYSTRETAIKDKGLVAPDRENLYPNMEESKPKTTLAPNLSPRSLSTRYSPDRVGVQAQRVSDGVVANPYTGKLYDQRDGYKLENGTVVPGGSVSLQTRV